MKYGKRMIAGIALTLSVPVIALAQTPPSNKAPVAPKEERLDSTKCAPSDVPSTTTGQGAPSEPDHAGNDNLSDKLAQSDGVICPPAHADDEIKAPTPPGGAMPVIPPPGSPGGDPNVQPK
jgi:hypothetical protein